MIDWNSPEEIEKDALVFTKLIHVLIGLYLWEWFMSLDFDWAFLSGKKPFRWPMIFYFGGRYSLLFALVAILITLDNTVPLNCQALYIFAQLMGNMSIGFASINLSVRVMALYSQKLTVVIPIVLVILGHWSLLLQGVNVRAAFMPGQGCAITRSNNTVLSAIFVYTMCLDLIVTSLTAYKLLFQNRSGSRSTLMNRIWRDGLFYFVIAFLSNVMATTFILLNLNPIMSVMLDVPSAVASTIVACRAVRRLLNFVSGPEVYSASNREQSSGMAFRGATGARRQAVSVSKKSKTDGVRIEMETFTELEPEYVASGTKQAYDLESSHENGVVV